MVTGRDPVIQSPRSTPWSAESAGTRQETKSKESIFEYFPVSVWDSAGHLQDEHVLSEVIAVFENDADGIFGESGGVGPFKLQP